MLTKGNFTRDEWNDLLPFLSINESLDVFLQLFSFRQKAVCHVQESSGMYSERGVGSGETETNEIGVEEPPECEFHPAAGN